MSRLHVDPDAFRHLAGRVVDLSADYIAGLDAARAYPETSGEQTEKLFHTPLPRKGMGARAFDDLAAVLGHVRAPGPRMLGYVLGAGEPIAAIADLFASVVNQNVTAWRSSPASVTIERTVVEWLAEAVGCAGFSGSLTGGGSPANLMGLAMAREAKAPANEEGARPAVVYASEQVHMSISKAVALLGLGRKQLRLVPTDDQFRMRPDELSRAIRRDIAAGEKPMAVVASAGTVNTGAIDPMAEIADIAGEHGLWMHVDGAYGLLAAMAVPEKFAGVSKADSLSLDPHKWLHQPLDCGCLLFRDPAIARATFSDSGDYVRSHDAGPVEGFCFFDESMELSRRSRGLKLWLSLRYHGLDAFRAAIEDDLEHAKRLAALVTAEESLELLAPVELSAVCFRHVGAGEGAAGDALNAAILKRVNERGRVYLSNAKIRGQFALRACFVNHRTTAGDVPVVVEEVIEAASQVR
ncbi:pyridoxal phosphate-dependent decarboxylase family protein [Polyangium aurulentum]|uniref:pyridoxal phosphate-dependent decarboxylase family protein n=1 Tax=Polyangium aurulentum TaxID=2567896 RepID=UPI0010ADF2DE|nr:pyridoxal-dependent decarboxylase [Polyangium aurulentum]UQA55448.1 pyridoxal-dependent decarboxylase [Polyangium aurulentum]